MAIRNIGAPDVFGSLNRYLMLCIIGEKCERFVTGFLKEIEKYAENMKIIEKS